MADFSDARTKWNQRYLASEDFLFGVAPNQWVDQNQHWLKPGMEVLSVADGEGRNAVFAASLGCRVTAFDVADAAVARARSFAADLGVELDAQVCDVESWDWSPERFDAVLAIFIQFAGPGKRERLFEGMARTLKPGGILMLEGYGVRQIGYRSGGPGQLDHFYTPDMLAQAFRGWEVLASRDEDRDLSEGKGHQGRAHLISTVLRKPDLSGQAPSTDLSRR